MAIKRKVYTAAHRRCSEIRAEIGAYRVRMAHARGCRDRAAQTCIRNAVDLLLIELRGVDSMVTRYESLDKERYALEPAPVRMATATAPEPEDDGTRHLPPCSLENAGFCKEKLENEMSRFANKGWTVL